MSLTLFIVSRPIFPEETYNFEFKNSNNDNSAGSKNTILMLFINDFIQFQRISIHILIWERIHFIYRHLFIAENILFILKQMGLWITVVQLAKQLDTMVTLCFVDNSINTHFDVKHWDKRTLYCINSLCDYKENFLDNLQIFYAINKTVAIVQLVFSSLKEWSIFCRKKKLVGLFFVISSWNFRVQFGFEILFNEIGTFKMWWK